MDGEAVARQELPAGKFMTPTVDCVACTRCSTEPFTEAAQQYRRVGGTRASGEYEKRLGGPTGASLTAAVIAALAYAPRANG